MTRWKELLLISQLSTTRQWRWSLLYHMVLWSVSESGDLCWRQMTTCTNIWVFCFCFCFVCTQCALETGNIHLVYEWWVCKKVLSRDQNVPLKKMIVQLSSRWLVWITEQNTPPIPILSSKLTQATKHRGLFHKTNYPLQTSRPEIDLTSTQ